MRIGPLFALGLLLAPLAIGGTQPVDAAPEGQITWASQVTVVPGWFDPGEASVGSASMVLYALHDALVNRCLKRSWPRASRSRGACQPTDSSTNSCFARVRAFITASRGEPRRSSSLL